MNITENFISFSIQDLQKTSKFGNWNSLIKIDAFHDKTICPVFTLKHYLEKTKEKRKSSKLLVSFKTFQQVTSSSIARWLKRVLELSGIDISVFQAHSFRGASCSTAYLSGVTMKDILSTANWSSASTFHRFYNRNIQDRSKLEYDETLLDECCVLPSKLLVPAMNQSFRLYSSGYTVFGQSFPVNFVWGEYPEYLYSQKKSKLMYVSDVLTENQQHHDIIRQIHLGVHLSENVRQCCRCGGFSLLTSVTKSSIMKAWEQRWQRHCLCAAHWKLYTENE